MGPDDFPDEFTVPVVTVPVDGRRVEVEFPK